MWRDCWRVKWRRGSGDGLSSSARRARCARRARRRDARAGVGRLIDCGCRVTGYTSDITRTVWFGEQPSPEFKTVYNLVHDAQTAAIELGKPLLTPCQEMDRAARRVIAQGGFGSLFTHRLGHGIGLDGHEAPYLVEGNDTRLEPGMVFTVEPGIYQAGKFGVRIEDDCVMTETGVVVLSRRPRTLGGSGAECDRLTQRVSFSLPLYSSSFPLPFFPFCQSPGFSQTLLIVPSARSMSPVSAAIRQRT